MVSPHLCRDEVGVHGQGHGGGGIAPPERAQNLPLVWLGRLSSADATRSGRVSFDGPTALTRRMPRLLQLSSVAETVAAARDN